MKYMMFKTEEGICKAIAKVEKLYKRINAIKEELDRAFNRMIVYGDAYDPTELRNEQWEKEAEAKCLADAVGKSLKAKYKTEMIATNALLLDKFERYPWG